MQRLTYLLLLLFVSTLAFAQSDVDVTAEEQPMTLTDVDDNLIPFVESFEPSNVGFLHVYVDPAADPLETYLFRGVEMGPASIALLPAEYRQMAEEDGATMYGAITIMGIEENLYLTRLRGDTRDQIDMFAARNGEVVHLKTLAFLNCDEPGNCGQLDSYITDLNLDTTFDLVQIERENGQDEEGDRSVYTMLRDTRTWVETDELDVPWEGITFYKHDSASRDH